MREVSILKKHFEGRLDSSEIISLGVSNDEECKELKHEQINLMSMRALGDVSSYGYDFANYFKTEGLFQHFDCTETNYRWMAGDAVACAHPRNDFRRLVRVISVGPCHCRLLRQASAASGGESELGFEI